MKRLFSKLFAHVLVAGLETLGRLIREEVAEESLCLPVSPVVVGAENKEGKVKVIQISRRPSPLPLPLLLHLLSQLQGHGKHPFRPIHLLSSHHGAKSYPKPDC